jgi:hypothetical protein
VGSQQHNCPFDPHTGGHFVILDCAVSGPAATTMWPLAILASCHPALARCVSHNASTPFVAACRQAVVLVLVATFRPSCVPSRDCSDWQAWLPRLGAQEVHYLSQVCGCQTQGVCHMACHIEGATYCSARLLRGCIWIAPS